MVANGAGASAELRSNRHWRTAVWALRLGYLALVVGIVGLIVSASWVLAVAVIVWLAAAAVTLTGVFRARRELAAPRPGFWPLRWMLLHDTVHARDSA
jgi:hypothetical protein